MDTKPISRSIICQVAGSSIKISKGDRESCVLVCMYMCAVLSRVKGSLSDELMCAQRPEGSEPCGLLVKESSSRWNAKTLRQEVCVRTKADCHWIGADKKEGRRSGR